MENNNQIQIIENKIFTIRSQQVMIDRDLAELYQVKTKVLNQPFKRNIDRFFDDYFQITKIKTFFLNAICKAPPPRYETNQYPNVIPITSKAEILFSIYRHFISLVFNFRKSPF